MNQNTKRILITGGCGYIGSHIAKAFKRKGYNVAVVDWIKQEHTLKFCDHFLPADYGADITHMFVEQYAPDAIVHCAGYLLVGESVTDPAKYYTNNIAKTCNFLSKLIELPEKPVVVFSSSASVYGNPATIPVAETSTIQPLSPYGQTKAVTEQLLKDFDRAYGLRSISLRYFNACGADPYSYELGQAPGASHIIAKLLDAKLSNQPFVLNGNDFNTADGTCVRDYVHVWDLAVAHVLAVEHLLANQQTLQLNLGTNIGYSIKEVIDAVKTQVGNVDIQIGSRRAGDPATLIADATLAKNILGWQPQFSTLPVIVDSAWKWYQHREQL